MSTFEDSILRVLKGDSVVGAAFLVSDRLVATCAHVLESAGSKVGETISLRLSDGTVTQAIVEAEFWRAPNAGDISIFRLKNPVENIQPVILGSSSGTKGHEFSTFGFPKQEQELAGNGKIVGQAFINGIRLLQLDSRQVTPGYSGAPIFDETTKRVVGMVVAIIPPDEYQRQGTTALAIPVETIREICSDLQISDICPYRSLDVFNEKDAPFFFGRERVVQKMIEGLKREPRFLAVLGPSGSGKSSVVRAGLIPALKQGKFPGSDKWGVITIRPASQPFDQLASAGLLDLQNGLVAAVQTWPMAYPLVERLVIVVDQFEELMVACPEAVREAFVDELTRLLESPAAVTVVIIMRDDFYSRFLQEAMSLTGWLERGLVNMPPTLVLDELRVMVEEPAKTIGLTFEAGLVDVILNDATEADRTKGIARSTVLPLLEFALTQLWERRQDGMLTHNAYNAINGVTGGLTQWADRAYYNLTPEERELARHILSDLVRTGNEAQGIPDTRRVRVLTSLMHHNETLSQSVIESLIRVRLLSTWRDEETGLEKIEIIHDALLREWGLLRDWITENRIFLAWRDGFETQIKKWEESNKVDGALLQGLPLIEAEGWLATRKDNISAIGRQFIEAGIALREKEKAEKERLYEQTVKQLERLDALRAIDLVISSTRDLQVTLNLVLSQIIKQLEVDAASILLIRPSSGQLEFVAGQGFYSRNIESSDTHIGDGYAGRAVLERRTVRVRDLRNEHQKILRHELLADEEFVSYIAVPLIGKGEVKGVLEIFHRSELNPDDEWLSFLETLGGQTAIAIENAILFQDLQRSNFELAMAYDATIEGWSRALDLRDKDTEGHTLRVTEMALKLARALGVEEDQLVHMRRGALLHDIGKMGIPDHILLKPDRLTDEEWIIMRRHPTYAYDMLWPIEFLRPALDIPYCHHEKWDGTGYPRGLKGEQIPLAARIFAVADVYVALRSDRPYRPAWSSEKQVLEYIRAQSGKHFDPKIVEVFLSIVSK